MSSPSVVYRALPADERQEFRLPALLKEHIARAAAQMGQGVTEYITAALADRVTHDLATSTEWSLSIDEQAALLKVLANAPGAGTRARDAAARADKLFGPLPRSRK